jgi:glycosyltransferase involved in cell wall biosynthesis
LSSENHSPFGTGPLVSVIIPLYNGEKTLDETLRSVRAQTYANLEIVIIDDGCKDRSLDIVAAHKALDPRIVLVHQANAGVAAARNHGLRIARGDFVAPLDADDLWHPDKIALQMQVILDPAQEVDVVYNWYAAIDDDSRITGLSYACHWQGAVFMEVLQHNFIGNASTPLMRREAVLACGGYDPGLRAQQAEGCEDFKLYLALAKSYRYGVAPGYLTGYRTSSGNMSSNVLKMLRSFELVVEPLVADDPSLKPVVELCRFYLVKWYLRRVLKARDWAKTGKLLAKMIMLYPRWALREAVAVFSAGSIRRKFARAFGAVEPARAPSGQVVPVGVPYVEWRDAAVAAVSPPVDLRQRVS